MVSRSQRIVREISLIRAALKQKGYHLQKQPRQAVWVISCNNGKAYRLTYQPAPISAWSLHPPDSHASGLLGIIDRTLSNQPTSDEKIV